LTKEGFILGLPYSVNYTNLNGQVGCGEKPSIAKDGEIIHAHIAKISQ
jgi:hypothetical protein